MTAIDCICPPGPGGEVRHAAGDTVTLRETLDFRTASTIQHAISVLRMDRAGDDEETTSEEILARLTEAYIKYGVVAWTVEDAAGAPVPVNPTNVERILLADITAAMIVGEDADELYSGAILRPLLQRASMSSADTPTPDSMSAPTGSADMTAPPTPLRPSSTTTTPTDDTGTTSSSLGGDYSSSPTSESVAS